ncbi:DNA-protecting protein DprA [Candidatus Shapirobacteria bacterium]|nr:DNA-protecting protein DprA [Candidatus Shapirobacteria bacterium]
MNEWKKWPIELLTKDDFPKGLRNISNPPARMFYRGSWDEKLYEKTITIVGSRRMTKYGADIIKKVIPILVANGITIISGFMYGVDIECHNQCLDCGGKTLAIAGGGLDTIESQYNEKLYTRILESGGLVMSEYEPNFKPTIWSFPQRDRLMSAISTIGVLVIEGGIKSGSLITAKFALKQGKRVMAIPGPINSMVSEGTNWLIKTDGAEMITEISDILKETNSVHVQTDLFRDYADLSEIEKKIIVVLENEAVTVDELGQKLKISVAEIGRNISLMMMRDLVEENGGKIYLS